MQLPLFPSPLSCPLPHPSVGVCTLCPLHTVARTVCAPTYSLTSPLPGLPSLLIVGRNPGYSEDASGIPFTGPTSSVLFHALIPGARLHILSSIYLTNICRCYHRDGDAPPRRSFVACRPHLLSDLLNLRERGSSPIFILTLGAEAASHVYALAGLGSPSLTKCLATQGTLLTFSNSVCARVYSTYHPAFLARENRHIHSMSDHLSLLASALRGHTPVPSRPSIIPPRSPNP